MRVPVQHLPHVAVLLLDVDIQRRTGVRRDNSARYPFDQRLFLLQRGGHEIPDEHADPRPIHRCVEDVRVHEPFVARSGLG